MDMVVNDLTNRCFESIKFYNANYGNEIKARLEEIVSHIKQDSPKNPLILIEQT